MMKTLRSVLAVLAAASLAACSSSDEGDPAPRAVQLFGTTFGASQLVELDPNTGELLQTIGAVGYRVNGLEYDHVTGKLFATTSSGDANFPDGLIEIDMATGAGTPIGTGAGMLVNNPTVNSAGQLFAWTENSDDLVRLDKTTGLATVVGDSLIDSWEHGLAFAPDGRLFFVNGDGEVFTLDATTGVGTSFATGAGRAHHGDFHPVTGLYWGIDEIGTGPKNLRVIDMNARTVGFALPTVNDLFAITFK